MSSAHPSSKSPKSTYMKFPRSHSTSFWQTFRGREGPKCLPNILWAKAFAQAHHYHILQTNSGGKPSFLCTQFPLDIAFVKIKIRRSHRSAIEGMPNRRKAPGLILATPVLKWQGRGREFHLRLQRTAVNQSRNS